MTESTSEMRRVTGEVTYLREFGLITKKIECTDAILGIVIVVIHYEPITTGAVSTLPSKIPQEKLRGTNPLQLPVDISMIAFWLAMAPKRLP